VRYPAWICAGNLSHASSALKRLPTRSEHRDMKEKVLPTASPPFSPGQKLPSTAQLVRAEAGLGLRQHPDDLFLDESALSQGLVLLAWPKRASVAGELSFGLV
jgi:hypothetical protein